MNIRMSLISKRFQSPIWWGWGLEQKRADGALRGQTRFQSPIWWGWGLEKERRRSHAPGRRRFQSPIWWGWGLERETPDNQVLDVLVSIPDLVGLGVRVKDAGGREHSGFAVSIPDLVGLGVRVDAISKVAIDKINEFQSPIWWGWGLEVSDPRRAQGLRACFNPRFGGVGG